MISSKGRFFLYLYKNFASTFPKFLSIYIKNKEKEEKNFWKTRANGVCEGAKCTLKKPIIVCHAASVGELNGVFPVIDKLRQNNYAGSVLISVGTFTGYKKALRNSRSWPDVKVLPAPFDIPNAVSNFLSFVNPDLFIFFEAEYWPFLYFELYRKFIPVLVLNARISPASYKKYNIIKPLISWMFGIPSKIGTVSENDKNRLLKLGASREGVIVTGNSKYSYIFNLANAAKHKQAVMWRKTLNIDDFMPVFVAGNLRKEECIWLSKAVVDLSSKFPDALYILAPRHMHRITEMANFLSKNKKPYFLLSNVRQGKKRPEDRNIILVDFIGALFELYALGDANFCGGTMVPVGGHNILEPVAHGKKVIHGRYTFKVASECNIISKSDAGITVKSVDELKSVVSSIFLNPKMGYLERHKLMEIEKYFSNVPELYCKWILNLLQEETP